MNKCIVIAAAFLLTGCPGPMDPVTLEQPAQVRLVNNKVCITVPESQGERIFSAQFGSDSGQEMYKTFGNPDQQIRVVQNECLPTFGFTFKPGSKYTVFYQIHSNQPESGRLFATRFSLDQDSSGKIGLTQFQRDK